MCVSLCVERESKVLACVSLMLVYPLTKECSNRGMVSADVGSNLVVGALTR